MKHAETSASRQRQLKFAEAGILFVLVLGLTIFLGVKLTTNGGNQAASPSAAVSGSSAYILAESAQPSQTVATEEETPPRVQPTHPAELAEPAPAVVTYGEAEQAYLAADYAGAVNLFQVYCRNHPGNAWGHYMLGLSAWKAQDLERAEQALLAALDIKPDHVKSLVNLGRVLLEQERPDGALARLEAAAAIDPASVAVNRVLARTYHNLGLLDQAVAAYRNALEADEDDLWSLNNLGLVLIQQERFVEALPALARAAQLDGSQACIQNNLGIALERCGHNQAAAEAYARVLELDEDYDRAEVSRSRVLELAGTQPGEPVDLAALAASFRPAPAVTVAAAARVEEAAPAESPSVQESEIVEPEAE